MPSPSRPARPMSRLPPVAPGRGPSRGAAGPASNTVNSMKLAGILMVVFAVLACLVGLSAAARGDTSDLPARLGSAFVVMVFGLGLVQGVNGVRVFLLVVAGLAIPGLLVLLALAKSAREVWMLVGAALLSATGYLLLLLEREAKRGLALTATSFVIIGSLAGLSAPLWLNSVARSTFSRELADAASSEGEYVHTGSGLWISPPTDWVRVRSQSTFVAGTSANAAYANPKNHTITYLHVIEGDDLVAGALDEHIDGVLERRRAKGVDITETQRVDTEVAGSPARRSETIWTEDGQAFSGAITAFANRGRLFALTTVTYGPSSPTVVTQYKALEEAIHLPGERKVDVEAAVRTVSASCPALAPSIIRSLASEMPEGAPPELWFHRAWLGALRGQSQLPRDRADQLRIVMRETFDSMSESDRRKFGAYTERIRQGLPTSDAANEEASHALNAAYGRIPETSRARFHELTELAYAMSALQ